MGATFPVATVVALNREISDHTPLLLSTCEAPKQVKRPQFKFELGWLLREDFFYFVSEVWNKENRGVNSLLRWQNKITRLRQFLR
jgi:hypothetical protein